jgi:hypothetical protein
MSLYYLQNAYVYFASLDFHEFFSRRHGMYYANVIEGKMKNKAQENYKLDRSFAAD